MPAKKPRTPGELYFGMQAEMGITKHLGGKKTTKELIELCRIGSGSYVLDVGCGVGKTPCYIAKEVGCRVLGADLREDMVKRSRELAERRGLMDKVEFRVADAEKLPFKDNTFDAVISESVVGFFKDRQRGINEFRRVVKPNGFVGINECTWGREPKREIVEYMGRTTGGSFLDSQGWRKLLENAGLREIKVRAHSPNAIRQLMDEIGWLDFRDFTAGWWRVLKIIIRSAEYRKYIFGMTRTPLDVARQMGHGIYVGRK